MTAASDPPSGGDEGPNGGDVAPAGDLTTMDELFRDFWWLLFPLAWGLGALWQGWLGERRRRDALDLIAAYADKGREAPPELVRAAWGQEG